MAFSSEAQTDVIPVVTINVDVISRKNVIASYPNEEIDTSHVGAQIKSDIFSKQDLLQTIPRNMIDTPDACPLILRTIEGSVPIANHERLDKFDEYFKGDAVSLEILDESSECDSRITLAELGATPK